MFCQIQHLNSDEQLLAVKCLINNDMQNIGCTCACTRERVCN